MKTRGLPTMALPALACFFTLAAALVPGGRAGDTSKGGLTKIDPALAARLGHLTLDDAIDLALRRNPDILRQLQEIQRLQGLVIQVRAAALPQLISTGNFQQTDRNLLSGGSGGSFGTGTATGTGTTGSVVNTGSAPGRNLGPNTRATGTTAAAGAATVNNTFLRTVTAPTGADGLLPLSALLGGGGSIAQRSYNVTIEVRQTLYDASILPNIRQQKFQLTAAYYALREQVDNTVNNVKTQFYTVLVDKALIDIQNENLRLLQSQLTDQQNRFAAGTVPRFDVLQASVAVANQRPQVIGATNSYSVAFFSLARLLGIEYSPEQERLGPIKLVGNLDYHPQAFSIEEGVAAGKANRAVLKQDRLNILSQVENIRVAAAGYQPVLTGQAGYEVTSSRTTSDLTQELHGYFFGANFNWNIFDGLATYGRVKQARALLQEAVVNYDDAVRSVVQDVRTNFDNLNQFKETIASQTLNVSEAEEAVRLSQARLSAGAGTQLDVLQSQTQLLTAQTTELQARYNYAVTLGNYERVTGTSTVYEEAFRDPLTTRAQPSGVNVTGAATSGKRQPLGQVKTNDAAKRGSGKPLREKINAEHPDRPKPTPTPPGDDRLD